PPPDGVSSGPLRASRVFRMLSSVAFGRGSPAVCRPRKPAVCMSHSNFNPSASRASSVASVISWPMPSLAHRFVTANGIRHHVVEQGRGPLVLLVHGFPEGWRSWRHQLAALSDAGYRAVAYDVRGYGQNAAPADVSAYAMRQLVADAAGLVEAMRGSGGGSGAEADADPRAVVV